MAEVFVGKASELKDGDRRIVKTARGEVGLFVEDGTYHAYSNLCPHQGGPACEGILINKVEDVIAPDRTYQGQTFSDTRHFVCPWHGWEYDLDDRRMRRRQAHQAQEVRRRPTRRRHLRQSLRPRAAEPESAVRASFTTS